MAKRAQAPSVRDIAAALERADHEVALVAAVGAWRAHKHPVLADLVEAIATRCKPAALAGRDKAAYQAAWMALATRAGDDPAVTGALAGGLLKSIPVRDIQYLARERDLKRHRHFIERFEALAKRPDDPRIATATCDAIVKAPVSVEDVAGVYGPAIELVIRIGDERSIARLRGLIEEPVAKTATLRDYFAEALAAAADLIERGLRRRLPLARADRALADELVGTLAPRRAAAPARGALDQLLAECLAHPDDDGPRLVYADALLERDDPRGELVQLQLRDARNELAEADVKRMASLQRKHEKTWLGDICRVTKLRVFRNGFLDEAELLQGATAEAKTWSAVARDPRMATVRILHKGSASEELYRTFVFSPALRSLRDVCVPSTKMLYDLVGVGRPLDEITLAAGLTEDALAILGDVAAKTGVRKLAFATRRDRTAVLAQLAAWPARLQFEQLCAIPDYRSAGDFVSAEWLSAFDLLGVRRIGAGDARDRVLVERGRRGLRVELVARQAYSVVWLAGAKLGAPLEHVVIRGKRDTWCEVTDAFDKALAKLERRRVEIELRDSWAHVRGRSRTPRARRP